MIFISLTTGDINLYHLIKVVSTSLLQLLFSPFKYKNLQGDMYFETMSMLHFHRTFS